VKNCIYKLKWESVGGKTVYINKGGKVYEEITLYMNKGGKV
jgi:hypothetical protein